ncbi:putative 60s ribosomal subunit assembly export protein loc1 protein [Phaeoacremonium minimum UCRPA7]|uniref:Putative 60s ribosomal subunit assembly export protein loc1 protein n=1 Tax=Phaeoacremonium minimum (strain UCR-PA7) TaxID=1286976 RepID=R8BQ73_PHAM7|nr:putative 60s ribosomal subunit assembly export protein loc1 protein [Phaeoacremonium minimum UCRPA7]EOO01528.1 putative 60s ribosomal subunit assembly export protein loc1 protein [Phaeoacremonium minimum UCRPA7]
MGPSRTKTVKNKHAASKSGIKGSKASQNPQFDPVVKSKKPKGKLPASQIKGRSGLADLLKKRKKKVYSEKELGLPQLNMITPVGVQKPKGKKKGKVFVDDRESMNTILAMVQAEKEGQIESKMMKARQMEEIREARKAEAEKKEADRKAKLDETKESLRRKRKRPKTAEDEDNIKEVTSTGTKASKSRKKKVSFAE